jgi:S1-C subfamily serine protease
MKTADNRSDHKINGVTMGYKVNLSVTKLQAIYDFLKEFAHVDQKQNRDTSSVPKRLSYEELAKYRAVCPALENCSQIVTQYSNGQLRSIYNQLLGFDRADGSFDGRLDKARDAKLTIEIPEKDMNATRVVRPYIPGIFAISIKLADGSEREGTAWIRERENLGGGTFRYWLITNAHVADVREWEEASFKLKTKIDGKSDKITVNRRGVDHTYDVGVLYFDSSNEYPVLPVEEKDSIPVKGEPVIIVGNQYSDGVKVHSGFVNTDDQYIEFVRVFQDDTETASGNSGSPVFNDRGKVVGICVSGYVTPAGVSGTTNYNVPITYVEDSYKQIKAGGFAVHGTVRFEHTLWDEVEIGALVKRYSCKSEELKSYAYALHVNSVWSGSQAENAGLKCKDVILEYDGIRIPSGEQISAVDEYVARKKAGDKIRYLVFREGSFINIEVDIELRTDGVEKAYRTKTGLNAVNISEPRKKEMGFGRVDGNVILYQAAAGEGYPHPLGILQEVNGQKVSNTDELRNLEKDFAGEYYIYSYGVSDTATGDGQQISTLNMRNSQYSPSDQ